MFSNITDFIENLFNSGSGAVKGVWEAVVGLFKSLSS